MEGNNFSLSDLRAVTDGADGISGGSAWLIILFLLIVGGNGFGGFGRNTGELNSYATAASQQDILFSSKFQALDNKIDKIGYGIADSTYALSQQINGAKSELGNAVATEGRTTQGMIADVRYDMANMAAGINSNIDAKFAALEKSQLEQRLAEQSQQIAQLQLSAQLCGIPRINQTAWGVYPYPTCNTGCGCN